MYSESMILKSCRRGSRVWLSAASILALLTFSACSSVPRVDVQTRPVEVERPEARPVLPNPEPINTAPLKFKVLTPETTPKGEYVYYGLTVKDYETLARNMAEIMRWVKEAKWRLDYYRGEGTLDGNKAPAQ